MGQRNIWSTNQLNNLEHDQQAQFRIHPEPCILSGTVSNYPQPSMNRILPEPISGFVPHGMTQYNAVHHHPLSGNLGPITTSNFYNPYMTPPGSNGFPPQINQRPHFVDGFGGYKRKSAEGYFGNFQYSNSVAGLSYEAPLTMEVGSHLVQGNYQVQGLIPANNTLWLDQRSRFNGGNGGTWEWAQAPAIPFIHAENSKSKALFFLSLCSQPQRSNWSGVNGGGLTVQRSSSNFQSYPPSGYPQGHPQSLHHQSQLVQGPFYPQAPGLSYGPPRNSSSHTNINHFQVNMEVGPGYVLGPVPPMGLEVHRPPHGRTPAPGVTMRHHEVPHLNLLPVDEVAVLEVPGLYEMGSNIDHHGDMRMDVDSMSYEELLALEEHMGYVGTGLSENTISSHLETRTHNLSSTTSDLDDRETDFCTICQSNYENQEKIGTLDCGHEYHIDCIKRWLVLKNICPICKSSALTTKKERLDERGLMI